jgi:hypothetical protein
MPPWVDSKQKGELFFGLERNECFPAQVGIRPGFQPQVVEETADKRIIIDHAGVVCEVDKDAHSTIPHFLKFPIETRGDWDVFKKRLDPDDPFRIPDDMDALVGRLEKRDWALGIYCGSLFGWIRDWMGFENVCMAVVEQPELIEEIAEHITQLILSVLGKVLPRLKFDFAHFWEDMAYNQGPMISPRDFRRILVPRYRRIADLLHRHGVDIISVDCDGNIELLAPLWLEAGVNVMFPLEVRAGSDPVIFRKKFGKDMLLSGGVDKMKLIEGPHAIDQELARLRAAVEEGGFLPHLDHLCPPDVGYQNYLYYLRRKRELFGIPA